MFIALTLYQDASLYSKRRPLQKTATGYNAENSGLWEPRPNGYINNTSYTPGSGTERQEDKTIRIRGSGSVL